MKCETYCQCTLERQVPEGKQTIVSWIPEQFATVGEIRKLKNAEGIWSEGWIVKSASPPMEAKIVEANARNYLKQRKASDI
jgi:hypothetical protein